ncbi:MAG: FG-GAP repeat domain-containing protein, partial [Raineya sp.]
AIPTAETLAQQDKFKYVERPFDFPPTGFIQTDSPVYPTFADLDGDGDLDLVLGLYGGGALFYQRNIDDNGKPVFDLIPNNDVRSPFNGVNELNDYSYLSPSFADMDGDGDLDMIVGYGYYGYGYVTLFKNVDGKFVPFTGTANPFIAVQTYGGLGIGGARGEMIDIGDDGDLDLFVSGNDDDKYEIIVRYYENEDVNSGSFAQRVGTENPLDGVSITNTMTASYYAAYGALTFADVDGDDDLDAYIGEKYGSVYEYKNNGDNTFAAGIVRSDLSFPPPPPPAPRPPYPPAFFTGRAITPAFNDLDEDGDLDCLYGDKYYETLPFAINNGSNSFTFNPDVKTATDFSVVNAQTSLVLPYMSAAAAADLDNDGDIDFATLDFYGEIRYFTNNGDGTFEEVTVGNPFAIASGTTYISTFDLADFDKDGDFDLVFKDYYTNTPIYYTNTGSATNPTFTLAVTNPFASISVADFASIQLVDFDADSDLDVLMGDETQIRYFQNTGS